MDLNNMMPRDILKMLKEKTITIDEVKNHHRYQMIYNAAKSMNLLNDDNNNEVFAASIDYDNIQSVSKQEYYTVEMNRKLKEYVDDAIQENGFSGDYNDLLNQPINSLPVHSYSSNNRIIFIEVMNLEKHKWYKLDPKDARESNSSLSLAHFFEDGTRKNFSALTGGYAYSLFFVLAKGTNNITLRQIDIAGGFFERVITIGADSASTTSTIVPLSLNTLNEKEFIPTKDYHPATKKYVDDTIQENGFSGDYNDLTNRPFEIVSEEVLVHITQAQLQAAWDANPTINGDSSTYIEAPLVFLEDENEYNYIIYINNKECLPNSVYQDTYNGVTRLNIEFYRVNDEENNISGGYYGSHYDIDWNDSQTSGIVKIDRDDESQPPVFTSDFKIIRRIIKRIDNQFLDNNLVINGSISFEDCTASGRGSTALGSQTKATAWAAHAEGLHTRANDTASHAEGHSSIANGYYSHAEGYGTIASGNSQHVQGKYNIEDTANKYAHIVGNGRYFNDRKNAHTLDWDGNAWFQGNVSIDGIPTNDKDLVTKKYVDDAIEENRPCYDERVIKTFNSAEDFNGDITGKVVIEGVSSASTEEITAKGSFIPKYVKMGDVAPVFDNLASNIENGNVKATCTVRYEHGDSTEVDTSELHMLDENCVVLMDSTWSNRVFFVYNEITSHTGTVLPPGIWYVYLDNGKGTVIYPISYSIEILDGDFKKLDYKYIDYMPGKNVEGEMFTVYDNFNDMYAETNGEQMAAQTGAEIFNDKNNVAVREYSHAEGSGTKAYGDASHAEGLGSIAFDLGDHAEGYYTKAVGGGSHSEGRNTISEGMWSHAENYGAYAKGWGSHAEGKSTIASGEAQHVQGRFNIEDTENKYAHIVGNGEYAKKRSNAHTLDWSGNAWFKGNVFVNGTSQVDAQKLATEEFVTNQIASLVDSAPDAMNTLNELANSINNHATEYEAYVATVSNALAGKAPASHGTHLELGTGSGNAFRGDQGLAAYNHSQAAHAPSNAQKNSDITKAEIEAKLTGNITSHTHSAYAPASHGTHLELGTGSGNAFRGDYGNTAYNHSQAAHAPSNAQKNSDITKAEIEAKLTGTITSHNHSGTYAPASHNHTSLTGITSLAFATEGSDSGSISTTVDGTNTYFDFNLADDATHNDMWRWRFTPSGGTIFNVMTLDATSLTDAKLTVTGNVTATSFTENGTALSSKYAAASHGTHLTLGTGSGNAYRGDYGNTAYNHSQAAHAPSNAQKNSDITKAEIEAKLTGTITSHNHNAITSRGNVTCESGATGRPAVSGLSMTQAYNNGYPTPYGNILNLRGIGDGQLLIGWSGTDGAHAPVYVRSKRDNTSSANWSDWAQVYTSANPQPTINGYTLWVGTQAQYDAISSKSSTTIYYIKS